MSASAVFSESLEGEANLKANKSNINLSIDSRYALYLFSNNKHASSSGSEKNSSNSSKLEIDEPSVCLSLLEGNLNAAQETVVRCYLLDALSQRDDLSFENEGKYAVLSFRDESGDPFGCYYHRLSKVSSSAAVDLPSEEETSKRHTFFVCLICPANDTMESFCPELSTFCCSLVTLLDHEGLKNKCDMQLKLNSWYTYCIEYVGRCFKAFQEDIPLILLCSLWGNVVVDVENQETRWDLERFIETCSLMASNSMVTQSNKEDINKEIESTLNLSLENDRVKITGKTLGSSSYCQKWFNKLRNCNVSDHKSMHSILEGFRLKTVQDLNTLKRLLRKSVNDHYSLYKAFLFLQASGYEDVLLYHVSREAKVTRETDVLDVIACLQEFLQK